MKIDHIGIAVKNLEDAIKTFEALGFKLGKLKKLKGRRSELRCSLWERAE